MRECLKGASIFSRQCPPHPASYSFLHVHVCPLSSSKDEINRASHSPEILKCSRGCSEQRWMERIQRERKKKNQGSPAQVVHNASYSSRLPQSTLRFKRLVQWHFLILSHTAGKEKKERKRPESSYSRAVCSIQPAGGARRSRVSSSQPGIAVFVMMWRFWTEQCW